MPFLFGASQIQDSNLANFFLLIIIISRKIIIKAVATVNYY